MLWMTWKWKRQQQRTFQHFDLLIVFFGCKNSFYDLSYRYSLLSCLIEAIRSIYSLVVKFIANRWNICARSSKKDRIVCGAVFHTFLVFSTGITTCKIDNQCIFIYISMYVLWSNCKYSFHVHVLGGIRKNCVGFGTTLWYAFPFSQK